jgi:hypothetical protein
MNVALAPVHFHANQKNNNNEKKKKKPVGTGYLIQKPALWKVSGFMSIHLLPHPYKILCRFNM